METQELEKYNDLIYSITKYFNNYSNKEDLYQAGVIGLLEAEKKYDKNIGVKFSTYAYKYILGEMRKYIREDKTIKISRSIISLNYKIEKAKCLLTQKYLREPSIKELSQFLEMKEEDIIECYRVSKVTNSLDECINNDEKELTLYDVIRDNSVSLDSLVALKEELNKLSKKERELIEKRYMYNLSQSETAEILGLSQVKVSREEMKIKKKIRNNLI